MLSSRDIAEMFKVSRTTVYNWEQKGILKPVFISPTGRKFYSEENNSGHRRSKYLKDMA